MIEKELGVIRLWWDPRKKPPVDDGHYVYLAIGDGPTQWLIRQGTDIAFRNYIQIRFGQFLKDHFFPNTLNYCNLAENADVKAPNKECLAFFT